MLGGLHVKKVKKGKDLTRMVKIDKVIKQSIHILEEQTYSFSKNDLMIEAYKQGLMLGITQEEFNSAFMQNLHINLKKVGFRKLDNDYYYTTPSNIKRAQYIDQILSTNRENSYQVLSSDVAKDKITASSLLQKESFGWEFSQGQKEALQLMLSSPQKYIAIEGIAGSGKTTMLEEAKNLCNAEGVNIIGMAFTGKAAEAMETEAAIQSSTVHKYLNQISGSSQYQNQWNFSSVKKASTPEIWVVDESSMLTDHLLSNILDASEKRNAKVVFLGDPNQLLPIGTGNGFARMTEKEKEQIPTVRMREINRQAEGTALRKAVEALSGKFDTQNNKNPLAHLEDNISEFPLRKSRINAIIRDYCSYDDVQKDKTTILVAHNKDRMELNQRIHKRLLFENKLSQEQILMSTNRYGKEEARPFAIGEKILFTKNDYKLRDVNGNIKGVKNGQLGKITDISDNKVTVQTTNNTSIILNTREYKHFDYGYALTSFKAQGITVDNALIYHDSNQKTSNTRNKIYVDISRAKKSVKIYTDDHEALKKQAKRFQKKITADTFKKYEQNISQERSIKNDNTKAVKTK